MCANHNPDRVQLESNIVEISKRISRSFESGCYDIDILYDFIYSWNQLADYYELHDDNEISVELVGIYLDSMHEFAVVRHDDKTVSKCKEQAYETLADLQSFMDLIITHVRSRLYPDG